MLDMYRNFDIFTRALVNSNDVDPTYPVLKDIIGLYGFEPEWFAFCYVGFYNIETGIKMCQAMPERKDWDAKKFKQMRSDGILSKFGHERRGTARNIDVQINMFDEIVKTIDTINDYQFEDQVDTNERFRQFLSNIPQHSTWACFKLAEVFEKALGYKLFKINDLGIVGKDPNSSDGTVAGLRLLTGGKDETFDSSWYSIWNDFGTALAKAYKYDIGAIETSFCKFNKMVEGKYYVGHDVAEFEDLSEILGARNYNHIMNKHFDDQLWIHRKGIQKDLKRMFADEGYIQHCGFAIATKPVDVSSVLLSVL